MARPDAPAAGEARAAGVKRRHTFSSLRTRIVLAYVALLALATAASVLIARQILIVRLDERIDRELVQETEELRLLAAGADPATGQPFGDRVRRIFRVALEGDIPSRNEAFLTFVDGQPFLRSPGLPYRLDRDPALVARWGGLESPDRGSIGTPAGRFDYLATPVQAGGETLGVFVVGRFRDREKDELDTAVHAVAAAGLAILLVGSLLAWRLAGSLLRPVRALTRTARSISESDLSQRIPVAGRGDEIAELAATFNGMLDRLERAFVTQRRFVDDAGHELRTPITIVRGHLELLDGDPAQREETIALVLDELDRMSRIVNDLIQLAKADEPDFLTLAPTDLAAFTDEVFAKASALAPREWLLERRAAGVVLADRQRLTQALVQLAQNAVQHAAPGGPIAIGSEVADGTVRLWVRDRGPGIAEQDRERIFERFAHAAGSRSDGAGLGLAIVKAIAEAHQGRVELASRPGAGATFTLVLTARPAGAGVGRA